MGGVHQTTGQRSNSSTRLSENCIYVALSCAGPGTAIGAPCTTGLDTPGTPENEEHVDRSVALQKIMGIVVFIKSAGFISCFGGCAFCNLALSDFCQKPPHVYKPFSMFMLHLTDSLECIFGLTEQMLESHAGLYS